MRKEFKEFLNTPISKELFSIDVCSVEDSELDELFDDIEENYFKKALIDGYTFAEYNHNRAGELLGKAVIIAYEFEGMIGVREFLKRITEKSFEKILSAEANKNEFIKMDNYINLKELSEIIKEESKNIEEMLKKTKVKDGE